ncbi:MAG: tripartite tricarboxylate transporter substrate binding protein [Proteobacteria bacterium]|nr:tripartite tricarboxylate transporter substrate binding protein [Pseudomonadota bacterium]
MPPRKPGRLTVLKAGLAACILAFSGAAAPQAFPDKPVHMVVPFTPAGSTSILARLLAQYLAPRYSQPVIVENKPGAGAHLGAEYVAKAAPDGHTLLLGTIGIHAAHALYPKLPYDPAKDLQPVLIAVDLPLALVVNPSFPAKTVQEFIALAKAKPGEINFGSAGSGSSTHMTGELFQLMAQVKLTHIPYKGSMPAVQDVMGGQTQAMFEQLPTILPQINSGRLRPLGVTSKTRAPALPNVPTIAESGVPGYESTAWFTVATSAKVPAPIVQKLNADLNAVLASPEVQAKLKDLGMSAVGGTTDYAARFFASETEKWTRVIKTANLKAE